MQTLQPYIILAISLKGLSYNLIILAILCYYTVIDKLFPETRMFSGNLCVFIHLCKCVQKAGPNFSH